jgi:mono/diheme cytochrome c family protein
MKKVTESQAFLFACIATSLSVFATLGSAFVFRAGLAAKQSWPTEARNASGQIVTQGRQIFVRHCAECHSFDARGEEGSDLHNLRAGDALVRQVIIGGIKGEMPAYGKVLGEADVRALIAYLRTLTN